MVELGWSAVLDWEIAQLAIDFIRGSRSRAGKWSLPVLAALRHGPLRHNQLLRDVDSGIHAKVFEETLHRLEGCGLISREIAAASPPAVSYRLTPLAESLFEPLSVLADWARAHSAELERWRDLQARQGE